MTIDDVDFTVLAATSVLSDLVPMCPPAEACRDAFVRMSKATISMVMSTTGFGNRSTLGTQPLNSSEGYFGGHSESHRVKQESQTSHSSRKQLPKFDMNLKDLFSEEEIASRPLHHQPKLQGFLRHIPKQPSISPQLPTNASPRNSDAASQSSQLQPYPQGSPPGTSGSFQPPSQQQAYRPFTETLPGASSEPDYSLDNLDFLSDFPVSDPGANFWGNAGDGTDLGFGNGGFDGSGAWEASGEVFDTFFFGNGGNAY